MATAQAVDLLRRRPTGWCTGGYEGVFGEVADAGPVFPAAFVRRPALVARLTCARNAALALIVAPPGYGKSALLSDWAEHDDRRFVWLGLGPAEASAGAVRSAPDAIAPLLEFDSGCVVVLDDAHLVPPDLLRGLLEAVLEELPDGSTLALASRTEPELPVGRLRAHRALVEIRMRDLAMSPAEAAAMFHQAGFNLDFAALGTLTSGTEGWPAALYLAGLSQCERSTEPLSGVAAFRGDDHLLYEYLRDEVLSALPERLMSFLVRTSVLERLSGPLCNAVLQARGSALTLAALARETELLVPLDPAHDWYRWHPLFRDALRAELRRADPELEHQLHRRASSWYVRHGDPQRAIEHACAAHDAKLAGELMWRHLARYLRDERGELIGRWLSSFADDEIAADARLALCAAHRCLELGKAQEAQHWALSAAAADERDGLGAAGRSLTAGIAVIDATLARSGAGAMKQTAQRAYELEPDNSPWRPVLCSLAGIAEHLTGNRVRAIHALEQAVDLAGRAKPELAALCLAQRAMIAIEQHDWELAHELTDEAGAMIVAHELGEEPMMAIVFAACAAARAHEGRAAEAKADLGNSMDLLVALGDFIPWYGAETRILLAHASLWLADVVGARTLLAQASRLARRTPDAVIFERWFDDAWSHMDSLAETSLAGPSSLTIAELRVLRFLPSHRSFREIAAQLGVSANTIKTQAHAVYRKLGVASRSEAVARAHEAGLLGQ